MQKYLISKMIIDFVRFLVVNLRYIKFVVNLLTIWRLCGIIKVVKLTVVNFTTLNFDFVCTKVCDCNE